MPAEQYHYWPRGDAYDGWRVGPILAAVEGLPVVEVALDDIDELDTNYWFHAGHEPTVRHVVRHVSHALHGVDPAHPVVLGPDGRVVDGMHRIVRALLSGETSIRAVRLAEMPPPDLTGCQLGDTV